MPVTRDTEDKNSEKFQQKLIGFSGELVDIFNYLGFLSIITHKNKVKSSIRM